MTAILHVIFTVMLMEPWPSLQPHMSSTLGAYTAPQTLLPHWQADITWPHRPGLYLKQPLHVPRDCSDLADWHCIRTTC